MPLTSDQQVKADALVKAFGDFMGSVGAQGPGTPFTGSDPNGPPVFTPALPTPPSPVPPPAIGWWRPTNTGSSFPPLAVGDYAGAQEYAGEGHYPNGTVALAGDRLERARKQSDALSRCDSADDYTKDAANRLVAGAGKPGVEMNAVIYACQLDKVDTSGTQNPQYSYGFKTIAEWVDYLQSTPAAMTGQGPGGPR